tara:strand:+ start:1530 stop:2675 length:1146 start_codon:yes stop_codon:yes gene_type:complete
MYKIVSCNFFSRFKKDFPDLDYKDCDFEFKEATFTGKYKFPNNVLFDGHAYDYGAYTLGVGTCYLENDSNHKFYGIYKIETSGQVSPFLNGYNVCVTRDNKANNKYYQQVQSSHLTGMPNAWFNNNLPRMTKLVVSFDANAREDKLKTRTINGCAQGLTFEGEITNKVEFNSKARPDHLMTVTKKGAMKGSTFDDGEVTIIVEYNSKARPDHLKTITKKGAMKGSTFDEGEVTIIVEYNSNDREDHLETVTKKGTAKESKFEGEVSVIEEYNTKARKDHLKTITTKGPAKESKFEGEVTVIEEYNTKARTDHLKTITKKGTAKEAKFVGDVKETRAYSDQVDKSSRSTTSAISDTFSQKRGIDLLCDAINQSSKRAKSNLE